MAKVIVTLKIMPDSTSVNLTSLESEIKKSIFQFSGETETRSEQEPIAFGLKALKIRFVMDESKGSTEPLENSISLIKGVQSVEAIDVRRAVG